MPGENSPIYAYLKRPSMVDYPGHLALVLFVSGCNFRCRFCHNKDLVPCSEKNLSWESLEEVCRKARADWVDGVVITGGEPTLAKGLGRLVAFLKELGFSVKLDTNGSRPEVVAELLPQLDYLAMDVKCSLEKYEDLTGFSNTEKIRKSLALLRDGSTPYELRTTVLTSYHSPEELKKMSSLVEGAPRYVLQPFVPKESVLDEKFRDLEQTPLSYLEEAAEFFRESAKEVAFA